MQLTRWNPLREMEDFFSQLNRNLLNPATTGEGAALANWAPAVDIAESPEMYTVTAELPGVNREDVKVEIDNGVLSLTGERKFETGTGKDEKRHRVERFYGRFERSFRVPEDVVADHIAAAYKDGVLTIRLPKSESRKPQVKQIPVQ